FISLTGWARHQRVDKPGKPAVPAPNDPGAIPLAKIPGGLANVPETLATDLDQDQDQEHEVARAPLTLLQGSTAAPGGMSAKGVPRRRSASAESMDLAKYLQDAIRESGPSTEVTDAAVEGWAEHIDKAVRLDKIPPASIRAAVDYAHRSPSGVFWRANILSGKKLREKLPTLLRQMDRDKPVKSASGTWEDL
ncbi:MAG TPA: hypothetical protein VEA41_05775, partial [Salinarimonas sp.]|nr:hypothetical protein [Salinarimonas sp.]